MKILFTLTLLLASIGCFAQEHSVYPNIPYTEFVSVDIIDDYIVALGTCDQIWSSTDGGNSWSYDELADQTQGEVSLIHADPSKAVIALRQEIVIYDLETEEIINSSNGSPLALNWGKTTLSIDDDIYLLTGDGLFKATLGVYDWEMVFEKPSESASFDVADIAEDFIFIGTSDGKIYSYDLDNSNTSLRSDSGSKIREITMGTNDVGYAIITGLPGVQKSVDGCASFTKVASLSIDRNVHAQGEDKVATILGFSLEVSTDGGLTSNQYTMSMGKYFGDIDNGFIADDGTIYAYGKGSTIAMTADNGQSFQFVNPYNRSEFADINIYEDGTGMACGEFSTLVATDDHGHSWSPLDLGISDDKTLNSIDRLSNGMIIIGSQEGIFVIEDNQIIHTEEGICSNIKITQAGNILAHVYLDGAYKIIRSADNGLTWSVVLENISFNSNIHQIELGTISLPVHSQNTYLSEDDGVTWIAKDYGIPFDNVYPYDDNVIMGIMNRDLYRSDDGGETWNAVYDAYLINNLVYESESSVYLTNGQNGQTRLMYSDDAGETWEEKYRNCTFTQAMTINSAGEVIMAQSTGHINIYPTANSTSTNDISNDQTNDLLIYPNPMDKNMALQVDLDWSDLQVINLEGRVVLNYNEYQKAIDVSALQKGMYIIRAQQNGVLKSGKLLLF